MTFIHYHKYKSIQYCIYGDGRGEVIQITNNNIFCIPDLDFQITIKIKSVLKSYLQQKFKWPRPASYHPIHDVSTWEEWHLMVVWCREESSSMSACVWWNISVRKQKYQLYSSQSMPTFELNRQLLDQQYFRSEILPQYNKAVKQTIRTLQVNYYMLKYNF